MRTLIPLFRPGSVHSGLASSDDCDRVFPDKLRVSSLPDRFPHYALLLRYVIEKCTQAQTQLVVYTTVISDIFFCSVCVCCREV